MKKNLTSLINYFMHPKVYIKTILLMFIIGIVCYPVNAGPDNIAPLAKVTASSSLSDEFGPQNVTDGLIHIPKKGEWISTSQRGGTWIQLTWDHTVNINKVIIYDSPAKETHIAYGTLHFSDGSTVTVLLIPNDGSARVVTFPAKKVEWMRFNVEDGEGVNLGLSEIEVFPAPVDYKDYVSWVDPYIETTCSRYFYFATGSQPFGMISAAPMTRHTGSGTGYNYNSLDLLGFPQIHDWWIGGINFMPVTGNIDPSAGEQEWKSPFSHDDEIVQPGYHRLYLKDYHIWVELTATDRVSFYRLTYTRDAMSKILLNLGGSAGENSMMENANVTKVNNTEVEGEVNVTRTSGNAILFFVVQFDKPMEALDGWADQDKFSDITQLSGKPGTIMKSSTGRDYFNAPTSGVSARYTVKAGDQVQVKFSYSYTSIQNARKNLISECNHWDFNKVRQNSRDEWNQWLGHIDVKGGTDAQKIKFYTDLWHTLLGRHKIDDFSGDYPDYPPNVRFIKNADFKLIVRTLPKMSDGKVKFHMYNSDAVWLTQWNLNLLWGLAWPDVLDNFAASLVQYADNRKLLPRSMVAGSIQDMMTGCPGTNLVVSAYMKGVLTKTDALHAFDVMKSNHMPGGMMEINDYYIKNGYLPGSAGITLEANFQDWALSQMAKGLKKKSDEAYFLKRSTGWKNLYNNEQKLIFPKDKNGQWLHTDPFTNKGWVEANSWQATWSVSHDIAGLAALMGGNDSLCKKLNYAFEKSAPQDFINEYSEGYISYANQPGCSDAHVFNYAGKPWLSQYWVRRVKEQTYGGVTPDKGYGGHDEDQGQMGGISSLMAIGLFSLTGTESLNPVYDITSPIFDEITINLDKSYYKGEKFVIKTYNNSEKNCYIQRASLNGKPLNQFWFYHCDFAKGGLLELWLGSEPNTNWGVGIYPPK